MGCARSKRQWKEGLRFVRAEQLEASDLGGVNGVCICLPKIGDDAVNKR
jgi:hypothetical protein